MNKRDQLLRKSRKSKNKFYRDEYKRKRNEVNNLIRSTKSNYTKSLLAENSRDPTKFWNVIKSIFPSKNKICGVESKLSK